jgi:hypothetical protein
MRRCIALACLAFVAPALNAAPAHADLRPGHYAGETSNILLGPAQVHLRVRASYGAERWDVEDLVCGCWQAPWNRLVVEDGRLEAGSATGSRSAPSSYTAIHLEGRPVDTTRLEGWGRVRVSSVNWDWRWWARWVAELAPAESDARALAGLGEEAAALIGASGGAADPAAEGREIADLDRGLGTLFRRIAQDAERVAAVEGSPGPDPYGPPVGTAVRGTEKVDRLERDAAVAGRRIRRRAKVIEAALRKTAVADGKGHRRSASDRRHLRMLTRHIGRDARKLWRELR